MGRSFVRLFVVLAVSATAAWADEVEEFLAAVDEAYYTPEDEELEDLRCHVVWPAIADGTFKDTVVNLYWKAPDRSRCVIENFPKDMGAVADQEKIDVRRLGDIIREPFERKAERFTFTLADDGDLRVLEGVPKEGTPEAKDMVTKVSWWFDGDLKLVKCIKEDVLGKTRWEYEWEEVEDCYLMKVRREINMATPEFLFKTETFEYEEVKVAGLVPVKVIEERMIGGTGVTTETLIKDYEANTGLDDSLFPDAK